MPAESPAAPANHVIGYDGDVALSLPIEPEPRETSEHAQSPRQRGSARASGLGGTLGGVGLAGEDYDVGFARHRRALLALGLECRGSDFDLLPENWTRRTVRELRTPVGTWESYGKAKRYAADEIIATVASLGRLEHPEWIALAGERLVLPTLVDASDADPPWGPTTGWAG